MTKSELIGAYFGYPVCCIQEFNGIHAVKRAVGNTGFIPCKKHFEAILKKEITLEDLIYGRICPSPFPNQGDSDSLFKFLDKIDKLCES